MVALLLSEFVIIPLELFAVTVALVLELAAKIAEPRFNCSRYNCQKCSLLAADLLI